MTKTTIGIAGACLALILALIFAVGCGGIVEGGEGDDPTVAIQSSTFSNKVLAIANETILETRPLATKLMVKELNLELANNAILDFSIDSLEQTIRKPLTNGQAVNSCPYLTKTNNASTISCQYLVDRAVEATLELSPNLRDTVEQDVDDDYSAELTVAETSFVKGWAGESVLSGIDAGAVHALVQLRNTKVCDQAPTPKQSAYKLGQKQGYALLEATEKSVLPKVPRTICNTDTVAATVLSAAKQAVSAYVKQNPLCAGLDASQLAVAVDLAQAEKNRSTGLDAGIKAAYEALRVRLVSTWQCIQPNTGDPLVVDLDDNGVQLGDRRVTFDLAATGEPVRIPALVGRDAYLALDLDGNGRIDSGAELLGNATSCGSSRCTDGVEALARHDRNADGTIDARDPVFNRLRLWRGVGSKPTSLAAAGIRAISLQDSFDRAFGDSRASSLRSFTFQRVRGNPGVVYDVWFNVELTGAPRDMRTAGVVSTLPGRYPVR